MLDDSFLIAVPKCEKGLGLQPVAPLGQSV